MQFIHTVNNLVNFNMLYTSHVLKEVTMYLMYFSVMSQECYAIKWHYGFIKGTYT